MGDVVDLNPEDKFTPSEPRRKDETRAEYLNRYRREKRAWLKAQGKPSTPERKRVRLSASETRIRNGEVDFSNASTEELIRGRLKDINGNFAGRPANMISRQFHEAAMKELLSRGDQLLREAYLPAMLAFADIASNPEVDPSHRIKAAQFVIERLAGKTPDRVHIGADEPWRVLIDGIIAEAEDAQIHRAQKMLGGEDATSS